MDNCIIRLLTGEGKQRRKDAISNTVEVVKEIRLSNKVRSIDSTIGFLIKKGVRTNYKVI